jgi:hypothetical protein
MSASFGQASFEFPPGLVAPVCPRATAAHVAVVILVDVEILDQFRLSAEMLIGIEILILISLLRRSRHRSSPSESGSPLRELTALVGVAASHDATRVRVIELEVLGVELVLAVDLVV